MKATLFILGSTRSGTSALRNALALTRYNGAGEGHTIGMLGGLSDGIESHFKEYGAALGEGTMLAEWQRQEFWNQVVLAYLRQMRRVFPGDYHLGKAPHLWPLRYCDP